MILYEVDPDLIVYICEPSTQPAETTGRRIKRMGMTDLATYTEICSIETVHDTLGRIRNKVDATKDDITELGKLVNLWQRVS